jgi:hypothetical protein
MRKWKYTYSGCACFSHTNGMFGVVRCMKYVWHSNFQLKDAILQMTDLLHHHYVGYLPLSQVYLIYTTFRKWYLLS